MDVNNHKKDDASLLVQDQYSKEVVSAKTHFINTNYSPDSLKKIFNKQFTVDLDDIKTLNNLVIEKCEIHKQEGFIINVDLRFSNRKQHHFGSWQEFEKYHWNDESSSLVDFTISWHINAVFEGNSIPQPHKLVVKLSNGMKPEEMLNIIFSGDLTEVSELENSFFPVFTQVLFTNRTFGNELIDLVGKWVDGLTAPNLRLNQIMKIIKKHKMKMAKFIEYSMLFFVSIGILIALGQYIENIFPNTFDIVLLKKFAISGTKAMAVTMISWFLGVRFTKFTAQGIYRTIDEYGDMYIFDITKHDKEKLGKMKKEREYAIIKLIAMMIFSIITNTFFMMLEKILF